jgi:hypothetical protein
VSATPAGRRRSAGWLGRHALLVGCTLVAGAGLARAFAAPEHHLESSPVLLGDGVGRGARFGQPQATALAELETVLGPPATPAARASFDCDVDAEVRWHGIAAYFDHRRFVGYSTLPAGAKDQAGLTLATARGLRVGDTLAFAARLYGTALRTSLEQGGSWFASTPYGTLEGFLSAEANRHSPPPRILTIEAGDVGCPAMSP